VRCAAGIVLLSLLCGGTAEAGKPTNRALTYLDRDATVVLSVSPMDLTAIVATSRRANPQLKNAISFVSILTRGALGFDVTNPTAWGDAGFDPDRTIVVQLLALDESRAESVFRALWDSKEWTAKKLRRIVKTYWRSRIVLPIRHGGRAARMLSRASVIPDWYPVTQQHANDIAMMLGEPARGGGKVVSSLAKRNVFAVGWIAAADTYVFATLKKKHIVIDLLGAFAGVPVSWARDKRALLSLISRRPGNKGFVGRMSAGAAKDVGARGLVIWTHPQRLLAVGRALDWNAKLTKRAETLRGAKRRRVNLVPAECGTVNAIARSGHLIDAAFTLRTSERDVRARVAFGLRAKSKLDEVLAPQRSAVIDTATAKKPVLGAVLRLRNLGQLRRLSRPQSMAAAWDKVWARADACGGGAATVLAVFGWPQTVGVFLAELVALDSTAKELIDGASAAAFAIGRPGAGRDDTVGVVELALSPGAADVAKRYLDVLFGHRKKRRAANKFSAEVWGNGPLRPYLVSRRGAHVVGFGLGARSIEWMLDQPRSIRRRKSSPLLFELKGNLAVSLEPMSKSGGAGAGIAQMLGSAIGQIKAGIVVDSDTIVLSVDARLK